MNLMKIKKPKNERAIPYYLKDSDFDGKGIKELIKYAAKNICSYREIEHYKKKAYTRHIFNENIYWVLKDGIVFEYSLYNGDLWRVCLAVKEGRAYVVYVIEMLLFDNSGVDISLITTYLLNSYEWQNKISRKNR